MAGILTEVVIPTGKPQLSDFNAEGWLTGFSGRVTPLYVPDALANRKCPHPFLMGEG
jgi:hypothetical protein